MSAASSDAMEVQDILETGDPQLTSDPEPATGDPAPPNSPSPSLHDVRSASTLTPISDEERPNSPYVLVPLLPDDQKAQYLDVTDLVFSSDEESVMEVSRPGTDGEPERVLGEYTEGRQLWYFARCSDGVVHRFPVADLEVHYRDLISDYEQRKSSRSLTPFDPSGVAVHPKSRVKLMLKVGKPRRAPARNSSSETDELIRSNSDAYESEASSSYPRRKSTRMAGGGKTKNKKSARSLPFSPKKTRARTIVIQDSDLEDDSDVVEVPLPTRKSTRTKKLVRTNLDDYWATQEGSEDSDGYSEPATSRAKPKPTKRKIVRGKASRPAYGHFRPVADLQLDEEDDSDTAPLRAHRSNCEKCHRQPTYKLLTALAKKNKKGGRKRNKRSDEEESDDEEKLTALGGWVRCLKCPVSAHWACLAKTQRDEILRAALEKDKAGWAKTSTFEEGASERASLSKPLPEPSKRAGLDAYQTTEFICGSCMKGGICMMCRDVAIIPDSPDGAKPGAVAPVSDPSSSKAASASLDADIEMRDDNVTTNGFSRQGQQDEDGLPGELLFRCVTCKRLAHYSHLPQPDGTDPEVPTADIADYYQHQLGWQCADCASFTYTVEHILAWRLYPEDAVEPPRAADESVNYKAMLPREYLVKWADRSYRRTQWVPHGWLLSASPAKLKNFLTSGTKVELLPEPVPDESVEGHKGERAVDFEIGQEASEGPSRLQSIRPLDANPDAERKIPPAWKTVDRVLDVLFWYPERRLAQYRPKLKPKKKGKSSHRQIETDDEGGEELGLAVVNREREAIYDDGEQPSADVTETMEEFRKRNRREPDVEDVDLVVWAFIKWDDRGYEDATWDSPPREGEHGYDAFVSAFERFLSARSVTIPQVPKNSSTRVKDEFRKRYAFTLDSPPQLGQADSLRLMPFQIDGVNWLCDNWWNLQHCILADEMGLGKTVQVATFIGTIMSKWKAFPALVVVPNSTITNWVREFERWAPSLRVVPFYGENRAREVIKNYELFHSNPRSGTTGAKYHVLVTTYEMITNTKEFAPVFKRTPTWEVLVVDEGQRLKNDVSLLFKKLKELNTIHRIIMTGTPINNNIRELFNLMNFLNPREWHDLKALSAEYEDLSEDKIKDLHSRLRPYFLRRIKADVLDLPPKNEVILPVSMTPLQREIYRSILSQNLEVLKTLARGSTGGRVNASGLKTNMNNVLMQLRKCLQHPYLVSDDIEPRGLPREEAHEKLIDASAKLRLLKVLLPKLWARGHRVLLFSQFSIGLDIVEDFLNGEGVKYLRLDGNTKQSLRQKGMDEFNKPGSDIPIYLLTTRAGGVGINLWSADTVIIFDPDFNPHQDLQAIARAHRFGQKKTVLVFKLMVKESAEERIVQTGKKKLVLDHLIVQKMDDSEGGEDVHSILMFGARTLFDEGQQAAREIHYSENDVEKLVEKTEMEGEEVAPSTGQNASFSFAKMWSVDKDTLEDVPDEAQVESEQTDSWAQALERIAAERALAKEKEETGRGVRRRAAAVFPQQNIDLGDSPAKGKPRKGKGKWKSKSIVSDESDGYAGSDSPSEIDSDGLDHATSVADDLAELATGQAPSSDPPRAPREGKVKKPRHSHKSPLSPISNRPSTVQDDNPDKQCGLCGTRHQGPCYMTQSSENLAQYRHILLVHAGDEPLEDRRAAIQAIDETLYRRGKIHLIYGQPLYLVEDPSSQETPVSRKKQKLDPSSSGLTNSQSSAILNQRIAMTSGGASLSSAAGKQQPEHPTRPPLPRNQNSSPLPLPRKSAPVPKMRDNVASADQRTQVVPHVPAASTSRPVPLLRPQPSVASSIRQTNDPSTSASNAAASSSKRSLSPPPADASRVKKPKQAVPAACVICSRTPHHLIKDCPTVLAGSKSMKRAIGRLEEYPENEDTVKILRHLLKKQEKRDAKLARASAIEISD
ncbi:hypothetical protein CERSUDRAFT_90530 [Gelatoporia subvermispora B]|uniref:Chromatin remodeling factor mit1 n=1 Tax=Ceriporiopsis subvermispora (strain B) TaxID=914234 RepID=M2PYI0_CERS8|nr:hypothetical protein CERSUDRAFT_90530 [Gelatoporia subvermispora B]